MPRIAVVAAQNCGKSTFIQDFIEKYPSYKIEGNSYREAIKAKKLKINKKGNKKSQEIILNCLLDDAMKYTAEDCVIHDRITLDNLIYSMYLNSYDLGKVDDDFIRKSVELVRQSMKFYDLIFYIPILKKDEIVIEEKANRDVDPQYRLEIDNIFKAVIQTYTNNVDWVFPIKDKDGSPPVIEIFGKRAERMEMVKLYLTEEGKFFDKDQSAITPVLEGLNDDLIKQIGGKK